MRQGLLFLLPCLLSFQLLLASNPQEYADSLEGALPSTVGETRFDLLHRLAEIYQKIDLEKAFLYADSAYELARDLERHDLLARSYNTLGKFHHIQGQYLLATQRFQAGLDHANRSTDDKLALLITNALGISYLLAGEYDEAFNYFSTVEQSFRASGQDAQVASTLVNIGSLYKMKGEPAKAIKCFNEALVIAKNLSHQELVLKSLSGLGKVYEANGDLDQALAYQIDALKIGEERNYPGLVISSRLSIGQLYQEKKDFPTAERYFLEARGLAVERSIPLLAQTATHSLGKLARARGEFPEALRLMKEAELQAERLENNASMLMDLAKDLSGLHKDMGNMTEALTYFQRYHDLLIERNESLNSSRMQELELAFSLTQQERQIEELNREKTMGRYRSLGLTLILVFAFVALAALYQRYRERQSSYAILDEQHNRIQHQNEILQSQNQEIEEKNRELAIKTKEIYVQNETLQRVNMELKHFARAASHDLREPLRAIKSFMDKLGQEYNKNFDTRAREYIHLASAGAVRMDDLLKDLYQYANIGRGREDFQQVDLNFLMKEVISDLSVTIHERQATVLVDEPLPVVVGIRTELRILLQNLVSNGLKFYPPGMPPKVLVRGRDLQEGWCIEVQDQGIGIAEENQALIFKIFERVYSREEYDGSGIGLATCEKIVNHHGGEITVKSKLGFGSTFSIKLPGRNG